MVKKLIARFIVENAMAVGKSILNAYSKTVKGAASAGGGGGSSKTNEQFSKMKE